MCSLSFAILLNTEHAFYWRKFAAASFQPSSIHLNRMSNFDCNLLNLLSETENAIENHSQNQSKYHSPKRSVFFHNKMCLWRRHEKGVTSIHCLKKAAMKERLKLTSTDLFGQKSLSELIWQHVK